MRMRNVAARGAQGAAARATHTAERTQQQQTHTNSLERAGAGRVAGRRWPVQRVFGDVPFWFRFCFGASRCDYYRYDYYLGRKQTHY